jgi:hypothetical protein
MGAIASWLRAAEERRSPCGGAAATCCGLARLLRARYLRPTELDVLAGEEVRSFQRPTNVVKPRGEREGWFAGGDLVGQEVARREFDAVAGGDGVPRFAETTRPGGGVVTPLRLTPFRGCDVDDDDADVDVTEGFGTIGECSGAADPHGQSIGMVMRLPPDEYG